MNPALKAKMAADRIANPIRYYEPNKTAMVMHADATRVRMASGANRVGKTVICVTEPCMLLSGIDPLWLLHHGIRVTDKFKHFKPPYRIRHWVPTLAIVPKYIGPMYQSFLPPRLLDTSHGIGGYNATSHTLHLVDGSWVQFMSYINPIDTGESVSLHMVIFDEPPPEHYFDRQFARITDTGGYVLGAMTAYQRLVKHPLGWYERRIRRGGLNKEIGEKTVSHYSIPIWENLHNFSEKGRKAHMQWCKMLKANDPAAYAACVLGLPGILEGLVYREFQEHIHAAYDLAGAEDFVALARKGDGEIWGGWDHGQRSPTAIYWIYVARRPNPRLDILEGDCIVFREHYVERRKPSQHIPVIAKISRGWPVKGYMCDPHMWDDEAEGPSVAGIYIKGLGKAGVCNRLHRANNNKDLGHELVGQLMSIPTEEWEHPQLRIVRGAASHLVDDTLAYQWTPEHERTGKADDKTVDVNDHGPDALRYFAVAQRGRTKPKQRRARPRHPMTGTPLDILNHPRLVAMRQQTHGNVGRRQAL